MKIESCFINNKIIDWNFELSFDGGMQIAYYDARKDPIDLCGIYVKVGEKFVFLKSIPLIWVFIEWQMLFILY